MPRRVVTKRRNRGRPAAARAKKARRAAPATSGTVETASPSPATDTARGLVRLVTDYGQIVTIPIGPSLERAAMEWSYVVRNRRRWAAQESTRREQAARSRRALESLGIPVAELASARQIQVIVPDTHEREGSERILPWEYLLSAATKSVRTHKMTVLRCLQRAPGTALPPLAPAANPTLFVESAPGELKDLLTFDTERRLVESNLKGSPFMSLVNPTRAELAERIRTVQPRVVHLTGVDVHQAGRLVTLPGRGEGEESSSPLPHEDGLLLRSEVGGIEVVGAQDLAKLLNGGKSRPALFSCNAYNSAARICALAVTEGCDAAIGFQDEFDDGLAELFFGEFYERWSDGGDAPAAFQAALTEVRETREELLGSGVVLWSSLAGEGAGPTRARRARARATRPTKAPPPPPPAPRARTEGNARELMGVEARPCPSLNYSLLHNNRDLFLTFRISKFVPEPIHDVDVEVVLHAGSEAFPYRASIDLVEKVTELRDRVRVPLTSGLARAVRESVHSVLYVSVSWKGQTVYRNTERVTLLDAGEWKDDDENRIWLPSFVLPRDPAVARIVDAAKGYLKVLRDDSGAGFDGYQPFDNVPAGDARAEDLAAEEVDAQVRAIWSALSYDLGITYINPPPTYSVSAQRLRTPGEVHASKSGTCIDLALLLAACLEYVDVYPVVFLLQGHAFPGYWRTPSGYADFERANQDALPEATTPVPPTESESLGQRVPWQIRKGSYREVLSRVHRRQLVPIETVALTNRGSFNEAMELGLENLRSSRDFHSMVDVHLARTAAVPVTPLPLRDER
jgi:hypothetical protein